MQISALEARQQWIAAAAILVLAKSRALTERRSKNLARLALAVVQKADKRKRSDNVENIHYVSGLTSEEQLKAFLEKVKGDTSLQEKLKAAGDVNTITAIAKEASFSISADEPTKAQSEISEEELEGATGGCKYTQFERMEDFI
jgi:predicted ribosomally synthesized peptide with nif11-like leader